MPQLIPQLMSCPRVLVAEDKDVRRCLSSSAAAAKRGRHRGDHGLEENGIQAFYSHSQLNYQQAIRLPEPLMDLQDIRPWGSPDQVWVGRAFC